MGDEILYSFRKYQVWEKILVVECSLILGKMIVLVMHHTFFLLGGRGGHGQLPGKEAPVCLIK